MISMQCVLFNDYLFVVQLKIVNNTVDLMVVLLDGSSMCYCVY